jgi:hypothetical protein
LDVNFAGDLRPRKRKRPHDMTDKSESGAAPGDPAEPIGPPTPKRGAFPTPKSEIDKATPYVPDMGEEDSCTEENPELPTADEDEKES